MINFVASKRKIMEYYEKLNINKLDNSDWMDTDPEIHKLLTLTQEETDNLKSLVSYNDIEFYT